MTNDVDLVEPIFLRDYFELLTNVYERSAAGKSLVEWLKDDWGLFAHPKMDIHAAKVLLAEILNDGEIVRRTFSPSINYISNQLDSWARFRNELMYQNRFFPREPFDVVRLAQLLDYLQGEDLPNCWYRARIRQGVRNFQIGEMSAPPADLVSHGRANPPGIPYLYLGSTPQTAAAEVRPHTGEVACVADFTLLDSIKVVDLRNPRQLVSPFLLADEEQIGYLRSDIEFLEHLGQELTRPVLPQRAAVDYVPSQYLCEFIKKSGYDGVIYRSSVSDGINMALFDPSKAIGGAVSVYDVTRVSVEVVAVT